MPRNSISRIAYERGLSDGALARRAGMTRSRLNRIKNRRLQPTVKDALLISGALGVALAQAFSLRLDTELAASLVLSLPAGAVGFDDGIDR
jgi:transcriptional regulator with XRE-family HTH domain